MVGSHGRSLRLWFPLACPVSFSDRSVPFQNCRGIETTFPAGKPLLNLDARFSDLFVLTRAVQRLGGRWGNPFHISAHGVPVEIMHHFGTRRLVSQVIDTAAIVARAGCPAAASDRSFHAD